MAWLRLVILNILLLPQCWAEANTLSDQEFVDSWKSVEETYDGADQLSKLEALIPKASDRGNFIFSINLANKFFDNGNITKAEHWAYKTLDESIGYETDYLYGITIHKTYTLLGEIDIKNNRYQSAKKHLICSCRVPNSPPLKVGGPSMNLVSKLFDLGFKNNVIDFLNECKNLWEDGKDVLDLWVNMIKDGRKPDFNKYKALYMLNS